MAEGSVDKILSDREKQHGDYKDVSRISQSLKEVFKTGPNWNSLTDIQKESLEMFATKFARILSGDSGIKDHWEDVAGYAVLGARFSSSPVNVAFDLRKAMGIAPVDKAS